MMKIEDVRKLAEKEEVPENIKELIYDIACTNLLKDPEFIKELEEQKALKKEGI